MHEIPTVFFQIELSEVQNLQSTSLDPQYEISKPNEPIDQEHP